MVTEALTPSPQASRPSRRRSLRGAVPPVLAALLVGALAAACSAPAPSSPVPSTAPAGTEQTSRTAPKAPAPSRPAAKPGGGGRDGVPAFAHVFLVVMENLGYGPALATPGFAELAHRYASATDYWAVSHPSLPNYLALTSGSTWGVTSDCTACYVRTANLGSQLSAAHLSWDAYLEGVPSACYLDPYAPAGDYAGKHNPFRYYTDIRRSPALCSHLLPFGRLESALAGPASSLPRFVWVTPNMCHDGHDCPPAAAAAWLDGFVASVVRTSAWRHGGVLFVTWDESESGGPAGGRVLTLVVAPHLAPGLEIGSYFTHYSLLATVEDAFGLSLLGEAARARPMAAFFSTG